MYGGKSERHFRVVQLEGKKVELGGVSITSKASPGSAARKLLTSIAHEKGLKKNKKASMPKVKFSIQEYTQGSSKKVYGPYVGHFHKYTATELKKAATAKGKVKFTMKPVVKLAKRNMKGGEFWTSENIKAALKRTANLAPEINYNENIYGILLTDGNDDKGKFHMLNLNALKEHGNFSGVKLNELFFRRRVGLDFFKTESKDPTVCLLNENNEWVKFEYHAVGGGIAISGYKMNKFGPLIIRDANITGDDLKKGGIYRCININVSEYLNPGINSSVYENTLIKLQFHGISNDHKTTWQKVSTTGGKRSLKTKSKK